MKKFRIHLLIRDITSETYQHDKVTSHLSNEIMPNISVTSAIRRGGNGSTSLFLLLTCLLNNSTLKPGTNWLQGRGLLYAGLDDAADALILAQSGNEAQHMLQILTDAAHACGIQVSKNKSFVIMYNHITNADN